MKITLLTELKSLMTILFPESLERQRQRDLRGMQGDIIGYGRESFNHI